MVCRRFLCGASRFSEPHGSNYADGIIRSGSHFVFLFETKAEYSFELWGWVGWRWRHQHQNSLDQVVHGGSRFQDPGQHCLSRQQIYDAVIGERQAERWKTIQSYQHPLFLSHRPKGERKRAIWALSNGGYDRGLPHEADTRKGLPTVSGCDHGKRHMTTAVTILCFLCAVFFSTFHRFEPMTTCFWLWWLPVSVFVSAFANANDRSVLGYVRFVTNCEGKYYCFLLILTTFWSDSRQGKTFCEHLSEHLIWWIDSLYSHIYRAVIVLYMYYAFGRITGIIVHDCLATSVVREWWLEINHCAHLIVQTRT